MIGGYMNRVLFVDLTDGSIRDDMLPEGVYRGFIGGSGLGANILYNHMRPDTDPLGPENVLGFVTGPLTGTAVPMSGRFVVVGKSPLTGTIGDANSGGYFGPALKAAGYDAVFFTGISPQPVYLLIQEGKTEIRGASHLWGKDTAETEEMLYEELGDRSFRIACIGPAGERLSFISSVITDKGRAAGRSGLGAVMGAKRLKAIAVKGTREVPVAKKGMLAELRKDFLQKLKTSPFIASLGKYGTAGDLSTFVVKGDANIKNWNLIGEEAMPGHSQISDENIVRYQVKKYTCAGCPVACGGIVRVADGPYRVAEGHKPEYESVGAFGPQCFNENVESIIKANDICNRYGVDTISAGLVVAFAMECYERGVIGKKELGDIELTWGNAPAIIAVLNMMVRREGFGDVLADGVKRAAERIGHGAEEWAIHIGGQEPAIRDPRLYPARGTAYLVDPTPGRHTTGSPMVVVERGGILGPAPVLQTPKLEIYGDYYRKGPMYALALDYWQLFNSSGVCEFAMFTGALPLAEFISAVTGWDFSTAEGLTAGRRIQTVRQAFNVRQGILPQHISLPKRIAEAATMGPFAGINIDFDVLKAGYFAAMGWDLQTGKPYRRALIDLGLDGVADDLWG